MKKSIIAVMCLALAGCASTGSEYLDKSMLCDVEHTEGNVVKSKMKEGSLVQDYPEKGYFVYQITGINNTNQSPDLVNGKGSFDGVEYTRTSNAYIMKNTKTGNSIFLTHCRKAF